MSHVATIDLHITDLGALEQAAKRLGFELMHGQTTYKWFGQHVGDYPLPAGFTVDDLGKCEHALRHPNAEYEIGVIRRRDGKPGYSLIWDFFDDSLARVAGKDCCNVKQQYAGAVARQHAQRNGFRVQEHVQSDGSIRMVLSK